MGFHCARVPPQDRIKPHHLRSASTWVQGASRHKRGPMVEFVLEGSAWTKLLFLFWEARQRMLEQRLRMFIICYFRVCLAGWMSYQTFGQKRMSTPIYNIYMMYILTYTCICRQRHNSGTLEVKTMSCCPAARPWAFTRGEDLRWTAPGGIYMRPWP